MSLCGRWSTTSTLSYRAMVTIMAERNIDIVPATILRWMQRHVPEFGKRW